MGKQLVWSVLSFLGSLAFWAFVQNNWVSAAILMVVIFIHEMGHYFAAKALGAKVQLPIFVVILALVRYEMPPSNQRGRFIVAMAGPLMGAVAAGGMFLAGTMLHNPVLLAAAKFGLILNAFQLIPVPMLDGGQAVLPISRRLWKVGIGMAFAFAGYQIIWQSNYASLVFIVLFWDTVKNYMAGVEAHAASNPEVYAVSEGDRSAFAVAYFGLCAAMLAAMYALGLLF
jgi:Zn-dependent protease